MLGQAALRPRFPRGDQTPESGDAKISIVQGSPSTVTSYENASVMGGLLTEVPH